MGFATPRARVLARASEEVRGAGSLWLGPGLPQALAGLGSSLRGTVPELAVVEVTRVGADGSVPAPAGPDEAGRRLALTLAPWPPFGPPGLGPRADLVIGPFGVLMPLEGGLGFRVLAVRRGWSARELQERTTIPLFAGPELQPFDPAPGPLFAVEGARQGPP